MGTLRRWIGHRFGLTAFRDTVLDRQVPKTPWYFGDGAALLLLLGIQVVTGIVLAMHYVPSLDEAYASVERITTEHPMGWFVRALHGHSAGLMVVLLFLHLFRHVLHAGYKAPREGTWLIGVVLFFLVHVMAFTGYVLRHDERAIHAVQVVLAMFERVPWIGEHLVLLVQGDRHYGSATLPRFYALHTILVPMLLLGLAGWHLYLVVLRGTFTPLEHVVPVDSARQQEQLYERQAKSSELGETFHPHSSLESGAMAVAVGLLAAALAWLVGPRELMAEANLQERSYPSEEWWFWWYSALVALLPSWLAPSFFVGFPVAVFAILVALPLVDRSPHRGVRHRPIAVVTTVVVALSLLALTDLRRRSPWTGWPDPEPPPVPAGILIGPDAELGRVAFARHGCNTCHAVAGQGPRVGPDLARLPEPRSRAYLRDFVLRPPEGVPMPAYEGRIPPAELEQLVDFVLAAQAFPGR